MNDGELNNITLREYLQKQLEWVDRYFERQLMNAQTAIDKAESQLNKRLEGMNEFRDTLKDQAQTLARKDDIEKIEKRISLLERNQSSGEGRMSVTTVLWATAASVIVGIIVGLVMKYIK